MAGWKTFARCKGADDPDVFFGRNDKLPMTKREVEAARQVCKACPVARECLMAAFQNREDYGVWGGLTVEERKRARQVTDSLDEALGHFDSGILFVMVVRL